MSNGCSLPSFTMSIVGRPRPRAYPNSRKQFGRMPVMSASTTLLLWSFAKISWSIRACS